MESVVEMVSASTNVTIIDPIMTTQDNDVDVNKYGSDDNVANTITSSSSVNNNNDNNDNNNNNNNVIEDNKQQIDNSNKDDTGSTLVTLHSSNNSILSSSNESTSSLLSHSGSKDNIYKEYHVDAASASLAPATMNVDSSLVKLNENNDTKNHYPNNQQPTPQQSRKNNKKQSQNNNITSNANNNNNTPQTPPGISPILNNVQSPPVSPVSSLNIEAGEQLVSNIFEGLGFVIDLSINLKRKMDLVKIIKRNGGKSCYSCSPKSTHLITTPQGFLDNTPKVQQALSLGIPILVKEFVHHCAFKKQLLDIEPYRITATSAPFDSNNTIPSDLTSIPVVELPSSPTKTQPTKSTSTESVPSQAISYSAQTQQLNTNGVKAYNNNNNSNNNNVYQLKDSNGIERQNSLFNNVVYSSAEEDELDDLEEKDSTTSPHKLMIEDSLNRMLHFDEPTPSQKLNSILHQQPSSIINGSTTTSMRLSNDRLSPLLEPRTRSPTPTSSLTSPITIHQTPSNITTNVQTISTTTIISSQMVIEKDLMRFTEFEGDIEDQELGGSIEEEEILPPIEMIDDTSDHLLRHHNHSHSHHHDIEYFDTHSNNSGASPSTAAAVRLSSAPGYSTPSNPPRDLIGGQPIDPKLEGGRYQFSTITKKQQDFNANTNNGTTVESSLLSNHYNEEKLSKDSNDELFSSPIFSSFHSDLFNQIYSPSSNDLISSNSFHGIPVITKNVVDQDSNTRIYVGGISFNDLEIYTEKENFKKQRLYHLISLFREFGKIVKIQEFLEEDQYIFITYDHESEAKLAIQTLKSTSTKTYLTDRIKKNLQSLGLPAIISPSNDFYVRKSKPISPKNSLNSVPISSNHSINSISNGSNNNGNISNNNSNNNTSNNNTSSNITNSNNNSSYQTDNPSATTIAPSTPSKSFKAVKSSSSRKRGTSTNKSSLRNRKSNNYSNYDDEEDAEDGDEEFGYDDEEDEDDESEYSVSEISEIDDIPVKPTTTTPKKMSSNINHQSSLSSQLLKKSKKKEMSFLPPLSVVVQIIVTFIILSAFFMSLPQT